MSQHYFYTQHYQVFYFIIWVVT